MTKTIYKEDQKMKPRLWFVFIPVWGFVLVFFIIALYRQLYLKEPFGETPMPDAGLVALFLFILAVMSATTYLMIKSHLVIEIREDGLWYRYPPILSKFRQIKKEAIERYEVRKYNAKREYGGYGIRKGSLNLRKKGDAYIAGGRLGLQLYLVDGKKVLFSTRRKEAILYAIEKMMNKEQ